VPFVEAGGKIVIVVIVEEGRGATKDKYIFAIDLRTHADMRLLDAFCC